MTAISKPWVTIADGQVDPDSPLDAALMTGIRDDLVHLREWLGASYAAGAAQNHSHDGVDSALVPIGANALRNGSFESSLVGWTTATFTGGTVAVNTANAMDGVNCLAFTSTVLANGGGTATSNEFIPAAAGMSYSIRGIIKASTANVSSALEVIWYNSAQAQISTSSAYSSASTPTVQTEIGTELTAPANTRFYKVIAYGGIPGVGSATGTIYFDQLFAQKPVGGLLRFTTITATDAAWAPLAATRRIVACAVGGGSGGAGGGGSTNLIGEGGHAGTTSWGTTTTITATFSATIGAGSAGATTTNASTQGGTTSFGSVASAVGGLPALCFSIIASVGMSGETGIGVGGVATAGAGGAAAANSAAGGASGRAATSGGAGGSGIIYVWEFA